MQGNNLNPNVQPPNNNGQKANNTPEYRLVIDEKPYRRRSVIPMLAMVLVFVGIIFGIKSVIGLIIGNEKSFDPNNVETRKFEELLNDRNVSFYIGDKIYTTRLSTDAEIVEIGNNTTYSLIRDSLYYKYSFKRKDGSLTFDTNDYSVDNGLKTVNYLNEKDDLVVSIYNLEQVEMDTDYMKKMCVDFINNTKSSSSSVPMSEYLKHAIIYGYKANLNFINRVSYFKDVENNTKVFKFINSEMTISLLLTNKELNEMEKKEFDDGLTIYINEDKYYIDLNKNIFEVSIEFNSEGKEVNEEIIHEYVNKSLIKSN